MSAEKPRAAALSRHAWLPLPFIAGLAMLTLVPSISASAHLWAACVTTSAALFVWWVAFILSRGARRATLEVQLRPQHYLQAIAHASIFLYWSFYWSPIVDAVPLLAAQILFAYAFDMLLVWSQREKVHARVWAVPDHF